MKKTESSMKSATTGTRTRPEPIAFHLLAKPTGATCNLDCKYCFFLSKDSLYPNERTRMSDNVLEQYIRQRLEQHDEPEISIAWQGGEPTIMGLDFFKRPLYHVSSNSLLISSHLYYCIDHSFNCLVVGVGHMNTGERLYLTLNLSNRVTRPRILLGFATCILHILQLTRFS